MTQSLSSLIDILGVTINLFSSECFKLIIRPELIKIESLNLFEVVDTTLELYLGTI